MASGKCYKIIYFATKVWLGAYKVPERGENSPHGVQSWRQTVQRPLCTTVHHARQGWEPIRLKIENMVPVYVKSRVPKIVTKSEPNIFKKIVKK